MKFTIKKKISPKQGRVVLFDGRHYHTLQNNKFKMRILEFKMYRKLVDLVDLSVDLHI